MLLKSTQVFLRRLHAIGAVKIDTKNGFRLALHDKNPSAPLSPFYINLRTPDNKNGPLQDQDVTTIAHELVAVASRNHLKYDGVTGIPRAGVPFAKAIARTSNGANIVNVVMTKRVDSTRSMRIDRDNISAAARNVTRLLIADDLITRADTKLAAMSAVSRANYTVAGIAVFIDREQGGLADIARSGIQIHAVVKISEMFAFYEAEGLIGANDLDVIRRYLKN